MASLIGTTIAGYTIEKRIGVGGFAEIYLGRRADDEDVVAFKILNDTLARQPSRVQRFQEEALNARGLTHPNIINIRQSGTLGSHHFIMMDFIDGADLARWLADGEPFDPDRALIILEQVCSALSYAHERGVIHRDIKPANVLVDKQGTAILTDFGVAKVASRTDGLTTEGSVLGTPEYMSPEQASGQDIDTRADLYALGILAYQLVTGTVPFQAENAVAVAVMHTKNVPSPPSEVNVHLPQELDLVIGRMLSKLPEERYNTANEFYEDFRDALKAPERIRAKARHLRKLQPRPLDQRVPGTGPGTMVTVAAMVLGVFVIGAGVLFSGAADPMVAELFPSPTPTASPVPTPPPVPTLSPAFREFLGMFEQNQRRFCEGESLAGEFRFDAALTRYGEVATVPTRLFASIGGIPDAELEKFIQLRDTAEARFTATLRLRETLDQNALVTQVETLIAAGRGAVEQADSLIDDDDHREAVALLDGVLVPRVDDYADVNATAPSLLEAYLAVREEADDLRDDARRGMRRRASRERIPRSRSRGSNAKPSQPDEREVRAERLWAEARRHYRNKDYDYAVTALDKLLDIRRSPYRKEARDLRKKAVQWRDESALAGHLREEAVVLMHSGQFKSALQRVQAHLRLVPDDERALDLKRRIEASLEKFDTEAPVITSDKAALNAEQGSLVISAIVTDDRGVEEVQACYQFSESSGLECALMREVEENLYRVEIEVPVGIRSMAYYVEATDEAGNIGRSTQ